MNSKTIQGGFTLIELVVVITILGILAAFAVPRFAGLEGQARTAAVQSLGGSVRSGAALSHALWLAQGNPASVSVTMEGQAVALVNGYPTAAAAGIQVTLTDITGFAPAAAGGNFTFTKQSPSGVAIANCLVTYTPAAAAGAPTVTTNTAGC
jgi:MSHA pilin protein MshA